MRDAFTNYLNSDFRAKNQMLNPIMNLVGSFNNDMRKNNFDTDGYTYIITGDSYSIKDELKGEKMSRLKIYDIV